MQKKDYNGIWKHVGCTLSLIAIFGMIALVVISLYLLIQGF
ncbi:hypothetical protein [Allomuricauda sp. F6463D]|nr:hypothetical protein [Muricauda sp. F6463D]